MPPAKPKPSEIAIEAKRTYIPFIRQKCSEKWPTHSFLITDSAAQMTCQPPRDPKRCRIGIIEGDPVDVALDWAKNNAKPGEVPVISMANEKRPGGDWEAGVMAPEECLCRRSNLYATLTTPGPGNAAESNYPIPQTGGIYSPFVVVFRSGPERYQVWEEFEVLPVISVAPVKRPKLDPSARAYSFAQEKELMKEKMRTALRIAAWYDFADVCLGSWGCGPHFRNPTREVASMWRDVLFFEDEFEGQFRNVVFAFDGAESGGGGSGGGGGGGGSSTSGSSKSSAKVSSSKATSSKSSAKADMEVFLDVFNPSKVFKKASK